MILAKSRFVVDKPELIKGKRVLAIEDGPTHTHGGMEYGAAYLASKIYKAKKIIDPRTFAVGSLRQVFKNYSHLKNVLPAIGYGAKQIKELEQTINRTPADSVIVGTPIDLSHLLKINKPSVRVRYVFEEVGKLNLKTILDEFVRKYLK